MKRKTADVYPVNITDTPSLRSKAVSGVLWSIVQNWGGKLIAFILSILLARILSPEEFGIASAAALALLLVPLVAEMGFSDAIMQRRSLESDDLNLPFFVSAIVALIIVLIIVALRAPIAAWAGLGGNDAYLVAIAATVLVSVPNAFQEAMYKRNLQFKALAFRGFIANIVAGAASLTAAVAGFGVWTFVVQFYVALIINVAWIWTKPQWLPTFQIRPTAFFQMLRIGAPILFQRIIDFFGTRTIDFVIISKIGLPSYGLYVVGSRIYLTLLQLLQGALYDVSLTLLSSISSDKLRMYSVYRRVMVTSSTVVSPIFVLLAALSPEICDVLFGDAWADVSNVASPLLLMGAVHCVQYMNGSFLSARGRPELILVTGVVKCIFQILAVLMIPASSVAEMTAIFVIAAVCVAPLSFYIVSRELEFSFSEILRILMPPSLILTICFVSLGLVRPLLKGLELPSLPQGIVLGFVFAALYLALVVVVLPKNFGIALSMLKRRGKKDDQVQDA